MIVILRVVDTETTGLVPPEAELVELAFTDVTLDTDTRQTSIGTPRSFLFRPVNGIPAKARSIHHINPADLQGCPVATPEHIRATLALNAGEDGPFALVAHNCAYDRQFLTPEVCPPKSAWVCTYKGARRVWLDAPEHGNSYLRYWLAEQGLIPDIDPAIADPPHRAGPDSFVTAHILAEMIRTERVADLVRWTKEPTHYERCPLGKFKDKPWSAVDSGMLNWILKTPDLDADVQHAARLEIQRRSHL